MNTLRADTSPLSMTFSDLIWVLLNLATTISVLLNYPHSCGLCCLDVWFGVIRKSDMFLLYYTEKLLWVKAVRLIFFCHMWYICSARSCGNILEHGNICLYLRFGSKLRYNRRAESDRVYNGRLSRCPGDGAAAPFYEQNTKWPLAFSFVAKKRCDL